MTKRNGQAGPPTYSLPAARLSQEQIDDVAAFQADMKEVERRFLGGEPGPEPKGILSDEDPAWLKEAEKRLAKREGDTE